MADGCYIAACPTKDRMLTDPQLTDLERRLNNGEGLRNALTEMLGHEPSLELLTWLRDNHFQQMTDAKRAGTLKLQESGK